MLRVLLNGAETHNQPNGLDEAVEKMFYDPEWFGYRFEMNVDLVFFGKDFSELYQLFKESTCSEISVEIQETDSDTGPWRLLFKGIIYTNDVEFDIDHREASTQVIDNGFVAKIINYGDLPINLFSPISKNGQPVSINTQDITLVDHVGTTYTRTVITQFDVLDFLLRYLTDDALRLESDFLSSAPANKYYLTSGSILRIAGSGFPKLKTQELLTDLCKIWALEWVIVNVAGQQKLKLEPITFFSQNATSEYIDGFSKFLVKSNDSLLISAFIFGSFRQTTTDASTADPWFLSELTYPWSSHVESSVSADGNCAVTTTLNYSARRIIYDTNTISAALNAGTEKTFDEDVFLVNSNADSWYSNLGPTRALANYDLTTPQQLKRWLNRYCFQYPVSAAACDEWYAGDGTSNILPTTPAIILSEPIVDGCWWTGAEILHNGNATAFTIEVFLEIYFNPADNPGGGTGTVTIAWDYLGINFMKPASGWTDILPSFGDYVEAVTKTITIGDTITYSATFNDISIDRLIQLFMEAGTDGPIGTITTNSYIKIYNNAYQSFSGTDCRRPSYTIEAAGFLSARNARTIKASRFDNFMMPNSFRTYTGTIFEYSRKITTGEATIKLNAKNV